jgi:hypothetical protein
VALCGVEAEIQAEIPLVAERRLCEKLADAALDEALLWPEIAGDSHEPDFSHNPGSSLNPNSLNPNSLNPNLATFSDDEIDSALSQTSWGFRQQDTGSYQIDAAPAPGHAMRVTLSRREGCLRASTTTSVRAGSVEVLRALATFALESNRRLRLARISVADGNEQADIVWDAVLPAPLPVAGALASIVDAVVYAQMFTRRSLNVLTDPRIAAAYLRDRPSSSRSGCCSQHDN